MGWKAVSFIGYFGLLVRGVEIPALRKPRWGIRCLFTKRQNPHPVAYGATRMGQPAGDSNGLFFGRDASTARRVALLLAASLSMTVCAADGAGAKARIFVTGGRGAEAPLFHGSVGLTRWWKVALPGSGQRGCPLHGSHLLSGCSVAPEQDARSARLDGRGGGPHINLAGRRGGRPHMNLAGRPRRPSPT
jgi:hypothetical protein